MTWIEQLLSFPSTQMFLTISNNDTIQFVSRSSCWLIEMFCVVSYVSCVHYSEKGFEKLFNKVLSSLSISISFNNNRLAKTSFTNSVLAIRKRWNSSKCIPHIHSYSFTHVSYVYLYYIFWVRRDGWIDEIVDVKRGAINLTKLILYSFIHSSTYVYHDYAFHKSFIAAHLHTHTPSYTCAMYIV